MAATEAPPVAPPGTPMETGTAFPSSAGEIHITPASIESGEATKPGSARESVFKELRRRAKMVPEETPPPPSKPAGKVAPKKPAETPPAPPKEELDIGDEGAAETPPAETAPAETPPAQAKPGDKKVSPWKLVDEYKKRAAEAEAKLAELNKGIPNEEQRTRFKQEMERRDARLRELEEEIRYVNYTKSGEFKTKYQEPYEKAWSRAMSELKEIAVTDPATGSSREIQPTDILELVNMPLAKAREVANQMFGEFAEDVMAHRKEIRSLFEQQNAAIEEAKTKGVERDKERMQRYMQFQQEVTKLVGDTWASANEAVAKDEKYGTYFTAVEGDEEGNQRLQKGFDLVDKAFAQNPFTPNLKPEERAAIVRRHAAVRNRAAAFGRLVFQLQNSAKKIQALETELKQYKESTPPAGGSPGGPKGEPVPASAREQVMQALRKIAK